MYSVRLKAESTDAFRAWVVAQKYMRVRERAFTCVPGQRLILSRLWFQNGMTTRVRSCKFTSHTGITRSETWNPISFDTCRDVCCWKRFLQRAAFPCWQKADRMLRLPVPCHDHSASIFRRQPSTESSTECVTRTGLTALRRMIGATAPTGIT